MTTSVPTKMQDVAQAAGVSIMTVSNTYQRPEKVRPETRARILSVAHSLGYVPNLIAGALASGRSRVIGAVVPSLRNSNFASMIQGLSARLEEADYETVLAVGDTPERQLKAVKTFLGRRIDGLLLTGTDQPEELRALLAGSSLPVVETWNLDGPLIDMAVGFSNYRAACALTQLIIAKGYRSIGFAGYQPRDRRFRERQRGFQEVMAEAGLRDDLLFFGPEALGFSGGRLAIEHLTALEPGLEALVCVTDVFAVGALFECIRRGWSVPSRFAVTGYGDFEIAAEMPPGLTTVAVGSHAIGCSAAEMLMARAEGRSVQAPIRDVGFAIVERGSL